MFWHYLYNLSFWLFKLYYIWIKLDHAVLSHRCAFLITWGNLFVKSPNKKKLRIYYNVTVIIKIILQHVSSKVTKGWHLLCIITLDPMTYLSHNYFVGKLFLVINAIKTFLIFPLFSSQHYSSSIALLKSVNKG